MGITAALSHRLLQLLLPAPCLGCGEALPGGRNHLSLCLACRGQLVPLDPERCAVCGRPLAARPLPPGYRCGTCLGQPPPYDRLVSAWSYEPPLDAVLQALKFRRLAYLGGHLAEALAAALGDQISGFDLVVPVALHWRRQLARGYNQAAEIARPLGRLLGLPVRCHLVRARATPAQTGLDREGRLHNLRGAFRVRRAPGLAGRRVLLVDDVVTTGAPWPPPPPPCARPGPPPSWPWPRAAPPSPGRVDMDLAVSIYGGKIWCQENLSCTHSRSAFRVRCTERPGIWPRKRERASTA